MARVRPEKLVEQALTLIVQIEGASPEQARLARNRFDQWRQATLENQAAAHEARRRWDTLFSLSSDLRSRFDEPTKPVRRNPAVQKRRDLLLGLAAIGGTGLLASWGWRWQRRQPLHMAQHHTGKAQVLKVELEDGHPGSTLMLSPGSELAVALYRSRRVVSLERGEVHFEVKPDTARPFEVRAKAGVVEVVGTAFTVRERGDTLFVGVEHGHVRVMLQRQQLIDLRQGQALTVRHGRSEGVHHIDPSTIAPWREGWLVFRDTPLAEALAELSTYLDAAVLPADAEVGALRFSGRFRSADIERLMANLPRILPVTPEHRADGSTSLRMRR
ncbi:MAG: DUF4974 domain-containing protein [Rubrivivax sp.]|nr:MAG: DUF4974 domain-containing protein [Rubrivivax sp.]